MGKTSPVLHATWRPLRDLGALCDLSLVVLGRKGRKVSAKYAKVAAGVGIAQVCDARNDERITAAGYNNKKASINMRLKFIVNFHF